MQKRGTEKVTDELLGDLKAKASKVKKASEEVQTSSEKPAKKCPKCAAPNRDDAGFCSACGSSLVAKKGQMSSEVPSGVARRGGFSYSNSASWRQVFYISMSKEAMSKVMDHAKTTPDQEVIGLLTGRMDGQVLVIEDSVTGETVKDENNVVMPGETLAKIADDIVNRKTKGNIVGWYHSHPGYGVFMSKVDNDTQSKLHQFSPYIIALVSDPSTGDFKFFTHDRESRTTQSLSSSQIHFYGPGEASVPESFKSRAARPIPRPTPTSGPVLRRPLTTRQVYALVALITIVVAITTGGVLLVGLLGSGSALKIDHRPATSGIIGNDIDLTANVTGKAGGAKDVVVYYKLSEDSAWKSDSMSPIKEGGTYSYTIRGSDVTGNLDYYIVASDTAGNSVSTPVTTIVIGDFEIGALDHQLTIYIGQAKNTTVTVRSMNGFNSQVSLEMSDFPFGIAGVVFTPQQVAPPKGGEATSTMIVTITPSAGTGEYKMQIQARYNQVTRSIPITVLVSGFDVSVSPSTITIQKGKIARYTVILDVKKGFAETISLNVTGLPTKGIDQTRFLVSGKEIATQGTTTITVEIATRYDVPAGTYSLTITATGGGITSEKGVTLIIK